MKKIITLLALIPSLLFAVPLINPMEEVRYCDGANIIRDADGKISRDMSVVKAFRDLYRCPGTGLTDGPCTGWAVDHVIPLACGGCDSVPNMQWLPVEIKSAKYPAKDRWERKIHDTGTCTFKIQVK